jgi:hypothetical protein
MSSLFTALGIDRLRPAERLQLIGEIWDSLPGQPPPRLLVIDRSPIFQPVATSEPTLDQLLQSVTEANVPGEW